MERCVNNSDWGQLVRVTDRTYLPIGDPDREIYRFDLKLAELATEIAHADAANGDSEYMKNWRTYADKQFQVIDPSPQTPLECNRVITFETLLDSSHEGTMSDMEKKPLDPTFDRSPGMVVVLSQPKELVGCIQEAVKEKFASRVKKPNVWIPTFVVNRTYEDPVSDFVALFECLAVLASDVIVVNEGTRYCFPPECLKGLPTKCHDAIVRGDLAPIVQELICKVMTSQSKWDFAKSTVWPIRKVSHDNVHYAIFNLCE